MHRLETKMEREVEILCSKPMHIIIIISGVGLTSPVPAATSGLLYSPKW
jgi:hypothetical protein